MTSQLITMLPHYIVNHIKLFTGEGWWRNGKYIHIHRIPRNDLRYELLLRRPKIKQIHNGSVDDGKLIGAAWFKLPTNKFMVIYVIYKKFINGIFYDGYIWELHYNGNELRYALR